MAFKVHHINFPVYGIIILLSVTIGLVFAYFLLKKYSIDKRILAYLNLMNIVFIFLGGKMFTSLTNLKDGITVAEAGLSSYGSMIGLIISVILFRKMYPKYKKEILNAYVLSLPLIYSLAKIACLYAGCCHGFEYNGFLHMEYDGVSKSYFPVQLLEVILFFILFLCLYKKYKVNDNQIVEFTIISCSVLKFLLDFFRFTHETQFLSTNQIASILIVIGLLVYKFFCQKKRNVNK